MAGPIYRHLLGIGVIAALVIALLFLSAGGGGIVVWLAVAGVLAVVGVAGGFAWRLLRDLDLLRRHIEALTAGVPDAPLRPSTEIGQILFSQLQRLQRHARGRERTLAVELQTASEILEAQEDPILVLDGDRRVLRSNDAAGRLFGDRLLGRDLAEAIRHPEVIAAVDAVLAGGTMQTVPLNLPVPIEREFEVRIQRFERRGESAERETEGPEPALLVTFYDLTASKRIEQMRADFVANASHELRTPLSSLMGFIETLRGPARDDAAARERFLGIMQQQAERMSRLVNDLLSLSRIELDEHVQPTGRVSVGPLLQSVADALELKAQRRGQRLELDLAPELPQVTGDSDQLYQVFQNLVSNAINYGRQGGIVGISARLARGARGGLTVSIRDQGEGIAKEHLPRLTERFYRVDPARSRAVGGTGLGLAIVKHIVSRHRGRLEIDSEVGRGSIFTVHLPAASGSKPAGRAVHKSVTELS